MIPDDDPLGQRFEAALAEAAKLRVAHEEFRAQVDQQIERMKRIEAELDPLLPHPPEELRWLRTILTSDEDVREGPPET